DRCEGEHEAGEGELDPAAAGDALALTATGARVEELALQRVQRRVARRPPVQRLGEARAAVERVVVALQAIPLARRGCQPSMDPQALAVVLDPSLQTGPFPQER